MNNEKYASFEAGSNDNGRRVDRIIRQFIPERSLNGLYKAFRKGLIRVNGKKVSPESKIREGDSLEIYKALMDDRKPPDQTVNNRSNNKLAILYEDTDLLALSKGAGKLVHGSEDSLEKDVLYYLKDKLPPSLSFKAGPLHRLDRNTSGLIFFSKSIEGARSFSQELQKGKFRKYYVALIDGKLKNKALWVDNLQRDGIKKTSSVQSEGEEARSSFIPIRSRENRTLVLIRIETGRTHQIRVQASHHGYPLSGDRKYGGSSLKEGYLLHSFKMVPDKSSFFSERAFPEAPLPVIWHGVLEKFFPELKLEQLMEDIHVLLEDK